MSNLRWTIVFSCIGLLAASAHADILMLRGADGRLVLTNQGTRPGHKVLARLRETSRPLRDGREFRPLIEAEARAAQVDPKLVQAVMRAESGYDPRAISRKGAMGLMQLMPGTARAYGVRNPWSPAENVRGGVRYLRYLLDRYEGNLELTLAAYNAGPSIVDRLGRVPDYEETRTYVGRVLAFLND